LFLLRQNAVRMIGIEPYNKKTDRIGSDVNK